MIQYMFMSLYIPMKYTRRINKKKDDFFTLHGLLNTALKGILDIERTISKGLPLPIGTSLIAVAKKNSSIN